jgi:hypothetical protein
VLSRRRAAARASSPARSRTAAHPACASPRQGHPS